jgi:hypothetical protein
LCRISAHDVFCLHLCPGARHDCYRVHDSTPGAGDGLLLVANKGDRTLGIIDTTAGQQVAAVPENGVTGHEVIASPDGKTAYVPIYGDSGVGKAGL